MTTRVTNLGTPVSLNTAPWVNLACDLTSSSGCGSASNCQCRCYRWDGSAWAKVADTP